MTDDVFSALQSQTERLNAILSSLDEHQWESPSLCPGWSVSDVVLHLAQTEEGVVATVEGRDLPNLPDGGETVDEVVDRWLRSESGARPAEIHARWDRARRAALEALRNADPAVPVIWIAAPLRPRTLATTRLSEHWIHTMDIAEPLGIPNPDTDVLKDIAWLAVKTVPYAFGRAGRDDPPTVRAELTSPSGEPWVFGPEEAECVITGPAGQFCRVAARRMTPAQAKDLIGTGERADEVLELVRTYA